MFRGCSSPCRLLTVAVLLGLVAGCSGDDASAVAVDVPRPEIPQARSVRGADPCRLLTDVQLDRFGFTAPGAAGPTAEGQHCAWRGAGPATLELTLNTGAAGVATLARNSEPTTRRVRLVGFPALETFTGRGEFCQYDVGVADDQVIMVALAAPDPDSCSTLQLMVPLIVANLPSPPR